MYVLIVSFGYPDTIVLRILHLDTFVRLIQPLLDADVSNDDKASHEEEIVKAILANVTHSIYALGTRTRLVPACLAIISQRLIHIPVMDC